MKAIVFSSHEFDREALTRANAHYGHELAFVEVRLDRSTAKLAQGYPAVIAFRKSAFERHESLGNEIGLEPSAASARHRSSCQLGKGYLRSGIYGSDDTVHGTAPQEPVDRLGVAAQWRCADIARA
jgi:hypothetical protein